MLCFGQFRQSVIKISTGTNFEEGQGQPQHTKETPRGMFSLTPFWCVGGGDKDGEVIGNIGYARSLEHHSFNGVPTSRCGVR